MSQLNASVSDQLTAQTTSADRLRETERAKKAGNQLRAVRQLHLYLGTLFAPAIIFFALTGAVQVLNLHETTPGSSYQPPAWIEKLAQVHKKQTLATRPKGGPPRTAPEGSRLRGEGANPRPAQPRTPPRTSPGTIVLKWFFFVMSLGLVTTTALGIYMSFKYNRDRRLVWGLLAVGTVIPVVLLFV